MPIGIVSGLLAGQVGKKIFTFLWSKIDEEEAPQPKHRDVPWAKVLIAGALQGAIFKFVRALTDRGTRKGFERLTGTWPGEERPDLET